MLRQELELSGRRDDSEHPPCKASLIDPRRLLLLAVWTCVDGHQPANSLFMAAALVLVHGRKREGWSTLSAS
jgi:hypothetical protein